MNPNRPLAALSVLVAASLAWAGPAAAQSASEAELARRLDALASELANVKAELAQLRQQRAAAAAPPPASAPAATAATAPVATAPAARAQGPGISAEPATVITS